MLHKRVRILMRKLSHATRDWLRRVRRAGRQGAHAASLAWEEYRIRYELTACMKFKNAARFLAEWIEFHRIVGFGHFYLYNNNSNDDYLKALKPYLDDGLVTLYEWLQIPAFPAADEHCVANHKHEARWIAFLDDDEFPFPTAGESIPKVLRKYESFPALAVHWLMFGSAGHIHRPPGLVLENYLLRASAPSPIVKSIVNPRRIAGPANTHHWIYQNAHLASDENERPVQTSRSVPATVDVLRINHYWSKSREDREIKIARGPVDQWAIENPRSMDQWQEFDQGFNEVEDREILRFVPTVRRHLEMRRSYQVAP